MTPERWQQIRRILEAALELSPSERPAFLDDACAADSGLRREVQTLISSYDEAGVFLEGEPLAQVANRFDSPPAIEGSFVGPYRLIREIGHGGMGTVFLAARADEQYDKRVAIKLVRRDLDSEEVLGRFRHERQILASLEHPNIARLLDGGTTTGGSPYVVMEYVEGQPIDRYCDEKRLSTFERLRLFRQVCAAVHYAHQNLVVHRDLKPSNIRVAADGTPKLLDFGIAKLLDPTLYAQTVAET